MITYRDTDVVKAKQTDGELCVLLINGEPVWLASLFAKKVGKNFTLSRSEYVTASSYEEAVKKALCICEDIYHNHHYHRHHAECYPMMVPTSSDFSLDCDVDIIYS